jgi:hypothetical protein
MNNKEQLRAMVAKCESTATKNAHALDAWYPISEHLRASLCKICGAMVWVTRPGKEKDWRIGGTALQQECLEDDSGAAAGD